MDHKRLENAYETVCMALLAARTEDGHWVGRLASSALSTATVVSALSVLRTKIRHENQVSSYDTATLERINSLIKNGTAWLVARQQPDGGWGDTEQSPSNPSTTLLVQCAISLSASTREVEPARDVLSRAELYLQRQGGICAIEKRYGNDRTFSVPILMNAALAGLISWSDVPPLPFELAWFPQPLFRLLKIPVVSYAIPALVAIGQVIHENNPTKNFLLRKIRDAVRDKTLEKVHLMQPKSGGFLEATPLTAFVVMSLSACGDADHPIVQSGVRFLLDSVREDASWPIDTNLAGWVTTLAVNALKGVFFDGKKPLLEWILSIQHRKVHPFTGSPPGGWAWTDLSGGVPDADDTAGALLAVRALLDNDAIPKDTMKQVCMGLRWLLSLQNRDGGWPTFCKGWNRFPFDRSGVDLTAHTIRAFLAWKNAVPDNSLRNRLRRAIERGAKYLLQSQRKDGSWLPLWFGNQLLPWEENPFYGTAKVLLALSQLRQDAATTLYDEAILRALRFTVSNINEDKGFGQTTWPHDFPGLQSSVEETALMLEALIRFSGNPEFRKSVPRLADCVFEATCWLVEQVESGRFTHATPIGLYFTKLWYHEDLYPILFTTAAFGSLMMNDE